MTGLSVDISCDLGEASSFEEVAREDALWPNISAANIACGGHTGDDDSMRAAVRRCMEASIIVGAHPSYPDRQGFGRRGMAIPEPDLIASIGEQLQALVRIANQQGARLERVKPHGALYNEAQIDETKAGVVAKAVGIAAPGAAIVCAPGGASDRAAREAGLRVVREAFADRRYNPDGSLVSRREPGALITSPEDAARQVLGLILEGRVSAIDGSQIEVPWDTICIHSDMPGSPARLEAIVNAIRAEGFAVSRLAH